MTQRAKCTNDHSGPRRHYLQEATASSAALAIDQPRGSVVSVGSAGALIGGGGAARG
jgi:hypothetical protein